MGMTTNSQGEKRMLREIEIASALLGHVSFSENAAIASTMHGSV